MATNEIPAFLRSPNDYCFGLSLLKAVSSNRLLISILEKGESVVNRKLLLIELNKHVTIPKNNVKAPKTTTVLSKRQNANRAQRTNIIGTGETVRPQVSVPIRTESVDISRSSADIDILNRIHNQRKQLYAERGHLHGRLHEASSDQARYEIATQLMNVQRQIDALNDDLDRAKSGDSIPKTVSIMTGEEVAKIELYKNYVRRYRGKLNKATTDEERKKYSEYLDKYQSELKKLINA
jgi:hypothetical protein